MGPLAGRLPYRVFGATADVSVDEEVNELFVEFVEAQQVSPRSQDKRMLHAWAGDGEDRSPVVGVAAGQCEDLLLDLVGQGIGAVVDDDMTVLQIVNEELVGEGAVVKARRRPLRVVRARVGRLGAVGDTLPRRDVIRALGRIGLDDPGEDGIDPA